MTIRQDAAAAGIPGRRAHELLEAWRAADRAFSGLAPASERYATAAVAVVSAWLAYQEQIAGADGEVIFVTDSERRYVAVSTNVSKLLGYEPGHLLGRQVEEFAAPELAHTTGDRWDEFLRTQREANVFALTAKDGSVIDVAYEARADFPVAGYHTSRLRSIGVRQRAAPSSEELRAL